ncbi:hypothetical protein GWN42_22010 [candidate division KSB1 bacterium]|nr:hypothetical protein [candidate division KSB1 bacterium]
MMKNKGGLISILVTALLGLGYAIFFIEKDPVLIVIFGLQVFRSGMTLRNLGNSLKS